MSSATKLTDLTLEGKAQVKEAGSALRLEREDLEIVHLALTLAARDLPDAARLARELGRLTAAGSDGLLMVGVSAHAAPDAVRRQLEGLTESMTPALAMPTEAGAVLSQRNARRRAELLTEFGALTGEQIAEERSKANNRHALAARWRKDGRIFGVSYRGKIVYPAFQFDDDGRVRPAVADVLAALPRDRMTAWEVALWWTAGNGWLGGRRPVDVLDRPAALHEAALKLAAPSPL